MDSLIISITDCSVSVGSCLITKETDQVALCWMLAQQVKDGDGAVDFTDNEIISAFLGYLEFIHEEKARLLRVTMTQDKERSKVYFSALRGRVAQSFADALGVQAANQYSIRRMGHWGGEEQHYGFLLSERKIEIRP